MKKIMLAAAAALLMGLGSSAAFLPTVGDGTSPNVWTRNMDGVLAAAKNTGYPIFLVMLNEDAGGEGCSHCREFMVNTLNTANFTSIVNSYKFYMVMLNWYGVESGSMDPSAGDVTSSYFDKYWYRYTVSDAYPLVVVIQPDGTRYKAWSYGTSPSTKWLNFHSYLREAIAALAQSSTVFSLAADSSNVLSVNPVPGSTGATWNGRVIRSGGAGTDGTVAISISGANAGNYSLSLPSLTWGTGDGSVSFTVSGPIYTDGGLVDDSITVSIAASGFDGNIEYGTTSQTISFRDARVRQSLADYAAAKGIGSLSAGTGVWYVPSSGAAELITTTKDRSQMVWRPSSAGIVKLRSNLYGTRAVANAMSRLSVSYRGVDYDFADYGEITLGVSADEDVVFTASTIGRGYDDIGLAKFEFSPLTVSVLSPANGASIPLPAIAADKSLANLSWQTSRAGARFDVFGPSGLLAQTSDTMVNGVDIGLVSSSSGVATYGWAVRAYWDCSNDGVDNSDGNYEISSVAFANFSVASTPKFGALASSATAYLKNAFSFDASAREGTLDGVSYSASGLPSGLKINSATGVISGTPKKAGSFAVTVTAANAYGSDAVTITIKVEKSLGSAIKSNVQLMLFDANRNIVGSALLKISSNSKWTLKTTTASGSKTVRGTVSVLGTGGVAAIGNGVSLSGDVGTKLWSGTIDGRTAFGAAVSKLSANWQGVWNGGAVAISDATSGGYAVVRVTANGKTACSGKLRGRTTLNSSGYGTLLPAAFVSANLPAWAGHGDVLFVHLNKRGTLNGGYALCGDGTMLGNFAAKSTGYSVRGGKWNAPSLASMNGKTFATVGGGSASFGVSATATAISAAANGYRANLRIVKRSGAVSVSYRIGRTTYRGAGVAYVVGGAIGAAGGGTGGKTAFSFVIR